MKSRESLRMALAASKYGEERDYWLNKLSGKLIKTCFPYDYTKNEPDGREKTEPPELDVYAMKNIGSNGKLFERLMKISKNSDYTLHMILTAGLVALLGKYNSNKDIVVGMPIYCQEEESDFLNTALVLRNQLEEKINFKELLVQVRETIVEANKYRNYPIEALMYQLNMTYRENDFPLFDVVLLLSNIHKKKYIMYTRPDIVFSFLRTDRSLEGTVDYNSSLYHKETIERISQHFMHLLEECMFNPETPIFDIDIIPEEGKYRLLYDFNRSDAQYPGDQTIDRLFDQQAGKTPGRIAVASTFTNGSLTYRELYKKSNQLACILKEKGVEPDTIVGIMMERSLDLIIGIWGILKSGAAYLPIDPDYPQERINYMLSDSHSKVLVINDTLAEGSEGIGKWKGERVFISSALTPFQPSIFPPFYPPRPSNLAYVIYTSGSTGRPKGVMVEHRNLANYSWWAIKNYVKNENVTFPLFTSPCFDLTVTSIFVPLLSGNTIIVYEGESKAPLIEKILEENQVEVIKLTPSHLKLISAQDAHQFSAGPGKSATIPSRIKCFIVGGEALETRLARAILEKFPASTAIYNEYGPTEATVGCMIYKYCPGQDTWQSVPIGIPAANVQVYLLDMNRRPVPAGTAGEIYISGDGVARGYLNRQELTAERFMENPFVQDKRMYRTGDLARLLPGSNIQFLGRIDQQIKISGYRVEPGEIESKLMEYKKKKPITTYGEGVNQANLKNISRCQRCLLSANYPGIHFDENGVCTICQEYGKYKNKVKKYFKKREDFDGLLTETKNKRENKGGYDCLLLYSGGKDSTYVLYQLIDMGLKVLTFTFDNGYISETAFANIKRITSSLKVENVVYKTNKMNKVFVESLNSTHGVCPGCWNALNTFGAEVASKNGINLVISGLSRGQIFEMRLEGLFNQGIFDEEEIEKNLLLFRKTFHSKSNKFSRILDVELAEDIVENIHFVDFFRYFDTSILEIREYLNGKGWIRPGDTGFCSSNCLINDVGIYMHLKEEGYHFYEAQLSWDSRLGVISRVQGLKGIDFKGDLLCVDRILREIGYYEPPITDAVVIDRKSREGDSALTAYLASDEEIAVSELRAYLSMELPDYMIPTYFVQVDKIPLTPNGKIDWDALPAPEFIFTKQYIAPRTMNEKKIAGIWAEVLRIERDSLSKDTNFFEAGGNSLKATILISKLNKAFNVKIPMADLFRLPTIGQLAEYIKGQTKHKFSSLNTVEKKEYYALSWAQKGMYFLWQLDKGTLSYNIMQVFVLDGSIARNKIEEIFKKLIKKHEILRTSFELMSSEPVQKVHDKVTFEVEWNDIRGEGAETDIQRREKEIIETFDRPFDLTVPPPMKVGLIKSGETRNILMVNMHHIASDAVSQYILKQDFLSLAAENELPVLRLQYKDYSEWQNSEKEKAAIKRQEEYWLKKFKDGAPVLKIQTDYPRPPLRVLEGNAIFDTISREDTTAIKTIGSKENATLFMVLLAIFNILLSKLSHQEDIIVGTSIANRNNADLEQIVGFFVNILVLRNDIPMEKTFIEFLRDVKEKTLEAFENGNYPFEELVRKIEKNMDFSRHPLFDVAFTFMEDAPVQPAGEFQDETVGVKVMPYFDEFKIANQDITLVTVESGNQVTIKFEYCTKLFKKETIEGFLESFKKIISSVIKNPGEKLKDIKIISEDESNRARSKIKKARDSVQAEFDI